MSETLHNTPNPRLLVIDDEAAVLKLVKTVLTRAQYDVTVASSAGEGLQLLDEAPFDCVITDAVMPVVSGYELVKAVRNHPVRSSVPVLMLTRKRHRQDVKKAVEAGVTDYVLKPIDEHLLLDKVELCLKKGGGKRHIYEHTVHGDASMAEIRYDAKIVSLSESDITLRLPFAPDPHLPLKIQSRAFDEMGIEVPMLKLIKCERFDEAPGSEFKDTPYEAKLGFMGVPEGDLKKIRSWLQRQVIQRRK